VIKTSWTVTEGYSILTMHSFDRFADALAFYNRCAKDPRRSVELTAHHGAETLISRPGKDPPPPDRPRCRCVDAHDPGCPVPGV
jgi:hypothetical protein